MLTSKQKSYLKSLANNLNPVFQIGKDGINEFMIRDILAHLKKNELMKVTILNNSEITFPDAIIAFNKADIEVVQTIGHILVLYKHSDDAKNPIELPY